MEILDRKHDRLTKTWSLQAKYEDNERKFKSYHVWAAVADVFQDCIVDEEENLVVKYGKEEGKTFPKGLAKEIAACTGKGIVNLFPELAPKEGTGSCLAATPIVASLISKSCDVCPRNKKKDPAYRKPFTPRLLEKLETKYYFIKGRKYYKRLCVECKEEPGPVSMRNPCYVCKHFHLNKTEACDSFYCNTCHVKLIKEEGVCLRA